MPLLSSRKVNAGTVVGTATVGAVLGSVVCGMPDSKEGRALSDLVAKYLVNASVPPGQH